MQKRHANRRQYFEELAATSSEFYLHLCHGPNILEAGCGEGGNLLPFAKKGWKVTGVDMSEMRIEQAKTFFEEHGQKGTFIATDFLKYDNEEKFDTILCHDVIEHIEPPYKEGFIKKISELKKPDGIIFFGFPAWQMPFGGHQQICKGFISRLPFVHLLPGACYRWLLKISGNDTEKIEEMMSIRRSKMTTENFENIAHKVGLQVQTRQLWFINPHYKQKFGLKPRKLYKWISHIPYVRNFFSTACFYILK
ncbi:MAG: class I SAM-dependent methyltransferase [Prevotella sp.]|jgi:SAM-dependent methyltransferase|nr:class I SAM-dependent methyltransferase [Prevotella sp.]